MFFVLQKFFLKKIQVCLDSLIYYTTDVHAYQSPIQDFFFLTNLLILICVHLFLSVKISSYLLESFLSMIICKNSFSYDHL